MDRTRQIRNLGRGICAAVFLAIVVVYARSLANSPVWDDRPLVVENPNLTSWSGLSRIFSTDLWSASAQAEPSRFYRPMTMLTFWVNALMGGRSAASFRLGNILIHATNAVLLAVLIRKTKVASWTWAGILALVWAIAPICSEPVMWISGRFDLLIVTFALLALLGPRLQSRAGPALTLVAIGCGILCKETFLAWLPVLLVDDLLVRAVIPHARPEREIRFRDSPIARMGAKYAAILAMTTAYFVLRGALHLPSATVVIETGVLTFVESFFFLVATFVRVLLWPANLDPFRPYAPLSALGLAITIPLFALVATAVIGGAYRYRDSSRLKIALLGFTWFSLATLPSALAGPHLDIVGDRYAYLPLVGLFLTIASLVGWLEARLQASSRRADRWRMAARLGIAALVLCEGWLIVRRSADWRNDIALADSSLASTPGNAYALCSLGSMAAQRGAFDEASSLLAQSLDKNATAWRTWDAICFVRLHQGRLGEAEHACQEGLIRNQENPRGWVNLASVYVQGGRWRDASLAAERAVALKARYGEARYLAAASAANLGNIDRARAHLALGIEADPDNPRLRDLERQFRTPPR